MLKVEIYGDPKAMASKARVLQNKGYKTVVNIYIYEKGKDRIMMVRRFQLIDRVEGTNPDSINFNFIPDSKEIKFALRRLESKSGKFYIMGKLQ